MTAEHFLDSPAKWEPPEIDLDRNQQIMDYAPLGLSILVTAGVVYLLISFRKNIHRFLGRIITAHRITYTSGAMLLFLIILSFRYQITAPNTHGVAYKLDRWTGTTTALILNKEYPIIRQ